MRMRKAPNPSVVPGTTRPESCNNFSVLMESRRASEFFAVQQLGCGKRLSN